MTAPVTGLPPLVGPGPDLTRKEVRRYSRHLLLPEVGRLGQRRLKAARVLVIGAGGLGSPVLQYLAAAGVGTIGIIDDDLVEESNLQRQVIHGTDQVGRSKVASAADAVRLLNPQVTVEQHPVRLEPGNALDLLSGYHLVLDGTDTFPTRYLVSDACELLGLPCVWGSVFRFDGQVSVFWAAAPPNAAGEPRGVTYRDLHPKPPPDGSVPSCAEAGVLGVICAAVGSVMATEAIKLICGIGEPLLGRLMVLDGLRMSWRTVSVRAVPGRAAVTGLGRPDGERPPSSGSSSDAGTITAAELSALLTARGDVRADVVLVDVRSLQERDVVAIPGSVHVPLARFRADADAALSQVAGPDVLVVLHCKTGSRSAEALALARAAGYGRAVHLAGGVLAWIDEADPSLPRY